jgi:hypothetical protein
VRYSGEIAPSVVPKLSLANGLVCTITKLPGPPYAWYVTALDYRTTEAAWSRLLGTGRFDNNHCAGIAISPPRSLAPERRFGPGGPGKPGACNT